MTGGVVMVLLDPFWGIQNQDQRPKMKEVVPKMVRRRGSDAD